MSNFKAVLLQWLETTKAEAEKTESTSRHAFSLSRAIQTVKSRPTKVLWTLFVNNGLEKGVKGIGPQTYNMFLDYMETCQPDLFAQAVNSNEGVGPSRTVPSSAKVFVPTEVEMLPETLDLSEVVSKVTAYMLQGDPSVPKLFTVPTGVGVMEVMSRLNECVTRPVQVTSTPQGVTIKVSD